MQDKKSSSNELALAVQFGYGGEAFRRVLQTRTRTVLALLKRFASNGLRQHAMH